MMRNNNKGFSLVELLIALAISGIVLSGVLLLVTNAVQSYTRNTTKAQIQNDADMTLTQIEKDVMEANVLEISVSTIGGNDVVYLYTQTTSEGNSTLKSGYEFEKASNTIYYRDLDGGRSLVCNNVSDFNVKINGNSIEFVDDGFSVKRIKQNVQVDVYIKLDKLKESREVTRSFRTRNDLSEGITFGAYTTDDEDYSAPSIKLGVGTIISEVQYDNYITK